MHQTGHVVARRLIRRTLLDSAPNSSMHSAIRWPWSRMLCPPMRFNARGSIRWYVVRMLPPVSVANTILARVCACQS